MSLAAKGYAYSVIAIGGVILIASLPNWSAGKPVSFLIYFVLSIVASEEAHCPPCRATFESELSRLGRC